MTLHACDTATDDAILFSLRHNAKHMMFVPCCQHELNKQLKNDESSILLKHGIFRDRMTALVTDTMRTQLLEVCGYKVQTMEFISLEHTAKNILLRCTKMTKDKNQIIESFKKTHLGNISLVQAPTSSYFIKLLMQTGIFEEKRILLPNSNNTKEITKKAIIIK